MPRGRLLLADRNEELLAETRELLTGAGYEVLTAADGIEARELVERQQPDGVIAALSLPRLDGIALASHLRRHHDAIPAYVVIPRDDDSLVTECLTAGARNVLVRPLKRTELLMAARSLMNLRSFLRARGREDVASDGVPAPVLGGDETDAHFFHFELFKRLLSIELKRARRYGFPLSVLLVAADGEPVGPVAEGSTPVPGIDPDARSIVGRAVSQSIRDIDVPVDLPGDQILVVMPHTDLDGALVVAERIRRKTRSAEGEITASIGVTALTEGTRATLDQILARANRALASARKHGGDRITKA